MLRRLVLRRRRHLHLQPPQRGSAVASRPFRWSSRVGVVGGAVAKATQIFIEDLVQPLWRHQHRLRRHLTRTDEIRHSFLSYEEWKLRVSCRQLLELLQIPKVAELLQNFLLGSPTVCRVVWLSDTHFLLCAGREGLTLLSDNPVDCQLDCNDSQGQAVSLCHLFDADNDMDNDDRMNDHPNNAAEILRAIHRVVALSSRIAVVNANIAVASATDVEIMVSQAQSPRTINVFSDQPGMNEDGTAFVVPAALGRILAFHCSAQVELIAVLEEWEDLGSSLALAMRANRCPTRLVLSGLDDPDIAAIVAPALELTTRIETLTISVDGGYVEDSVLNAIGSNQGIRTLVLDSFSSSPLFLELFWNAVMVSPSIQSIEFRGRAMLYEDWERRDCARTVATLIRSNRVLSSIRYDPTNHDPTIMESRVVPILCVNRLRPLVKHWMESSGGANGERATSLLLCAPLVRRHPELLYFVVKSCRSHLLPGLRRGGNGNDADARTSIDTTTTVGVAPTPDETNSTPKAASPPTPRSERWTRVLPRPPCRRDQEDDIPMG